MVIFWRPHSFNISLKDAWEQFGLIPDLRISFHVNVMPVLTKLYWEGRKMARGNSICVVAVNVIILYEKNHSKLCTVHFYIKY